MNALHLNGYCENLRAYILDIARTRVTFKKLFEKALPRKADLIHALYDDEVCLNAQIVMKSLAKLNVKDGQVYVWITPGTFSMGCSAGDAECHAEEKPSHTVTISSGFWIGQTVVTVDAWKRYRNAVGAPALPTSDPYGRSDLNEAGPGEMPVVLTGDMPVVLISWSQASNYCVWAGGQLPLRHSGSLQPGQAIIVRIQATLMTQHCPPREALLMAKSGIR